ncbi:hypothetical protein [Agrilutibacter solisilvae]|uniref:DUF1440 domain-containing protein n=1 Tax=Agrilutibacter solisilvae TaxID=2763317 RepID=A0A974Y6M7_9GAMM|nr:hypothetical protein [Lysobacter solisilvae]QSX79801.1 hypothetical protein I8J32_008210 [Lysobacter solisilvae]
MASIHPPLTSAPPRAWWPVLLAGVVVGTLDLVFVFTFWGVGWDVAPTRILHSIAAGIQGAAAHQGGTASAALGAACHYFIATCMAAAWWLASGRWALLRQRPLACGLAYGLLLYGFMTWVVVPLSNAPPGGRMPLAWTLSSIAMHALIGVICASLATPGRRGR